MTNVSIEPGEVFALLGPNGAGKTTTVEILEGHRSRTSGTVDVLGFDPATGGRAYRERIGIVLQEAGFDEEFTVAELVTLYAGMYPRRRDVDELIDRVGLTDKAAARTKTLSGGQRRRLDLALGLVGDPELPDEDCRISWQAGAVERSLDDTWEQIDQIVARVLAGQPERPRGSRAGGTDGEDHDAASTDAGEPTS